jgi:hypothetical protein
LVTLDHMDVHYKLYMESSHPMFPSTDECIKKMSYIYTVEHNSAIKSMNFYHFWQHR